MSAEASFFSVSNDTLVINGGSEWWFYFKEIKKKGEIPVLRNLTEMLSGGIPVYFVKNQEKEGSIIFMQIRVVFNSVFK